MGSNINLSIQQHYLKQPYGLAKHIEKPPKQIFKKECLHHKAATKLSMN